MKRRKCIVVLAIIMLFMLSSLSGCGKVKESSIAQVEIKTISNQLETWKEELPQDTEAMGIDAEAIRGLEIRKDGNTVFAVSYEPRDYKDSYDYWDISVPYKSLVCVNTETLYELFSTLTTIVWVEQENVSFEDAKLDKTENTIFISYNDETKTGGKGKPEPTKGKEILIGSEDDDGSYYVGISGSDKVYLANKILIDAVLDVKPFDYILKIPALLNLNTVLQVNVFMNEKEYCIVRDEENWQLEDMEIVQEDFQKYYTELLGILIAEELPKDVELKVDRIPVLTIQFLRTAEEVSDVEVKYYAYDDEFMSVNVNGQECFLVEADSVENLKKAISKLFEEK